MSSAMTHSEQETLGLMEALAEMLRAEVLPTHLPLVQLIGKICEDPTLKQVDLYSKYTRLAAVVGGDWITMKEELRNATHFGAAAFYCSISAMLAVFTCRRSRSHDELVSSLTELYNHISAGNEILNKQVEYAITTMGKQIEHANVAEASITNLNERVDNTITTMEKQEELVKKAEASITTIIERADHVKTVIEKQVEQVNKVEMSIANITKQAHNINNQTNIAERTTIPSASSDKKAMEELKQDNTDVVLIPETKFHCKYGTLTIDSQSQCTFSSGNSMEAKSLALWLTLPTESINDRTTLMNLDHEDLIKKAKLNLSLIHFFKHGYSPLQRRNMLSNIFKNIEYKAGQWSFIC